MSYNILVVAVDSVNSLKAAKEAGDLAKQIPGAVIRLLYVYPIQTVTAQREKKIDYQHMVELQSELVLGSIMDHLERQAIPYESMVRVGNLLQEISLNVQMNDCRMVVITRFPQQKKMKLETVLNHVKCPVLVVP